MSQNMWTLVLLHFLKMRKQRYWVRVLHGKQFPGSSFLISHQRIHTGEKLYDLATVGKNSIMKQTLISTSESLQGRNPIPVLSVVETLIRIFIRVTMKEFM